jgi:hypothetical protein
LTFLFSNARQRSTRRSTQTRHLTSCQPAPAPPSLLRCRLCVVVMSPRHLCCDDVCTALTNTLAQPRLPNSDSNTVADKRGRPFFWLNGRKNVLLHRRHHLPALFARLSRRCVTHAMTTHAPVDDVHSHHTHTHSHTTVQTHTQTSRPTFQLARSLEERKRAPIDHWTWSQHEYTPSHSNGVRRRSSPRCVCDDTDARAVAVLAAYAGWKESASELATDGALSNEK